MLMSEEQGNRMAEAIEDFSQTISVDPKFNIPARALGPLLEMNLAADAWRKEGEK